MLIIAKTFTLLYVNCKEEILDFLIQNFKLEKLKLPWMYDPIGEFIRIVKANKKWSMFNHESKLNTKYFVN